jgi:hypothetical protein
VNEIEPEKPEGDNRISKKKKKKRYRPERNLEGKEVSGTSHKAIDNPAIVNVSRSHGGDK